MQFYSISFMHPYKQCGRWQDMLDIKYILPSTRLQALPAIDMTAYINAWKKYHKTACTNLPKDEHLDVRSMSKTLQLKLKHQCKSVHFVGSYYIGNFNTILLSVCCWSKWVYLRADRPTDTLRTLLGCTGTSLLNLNSPVICSDEKNLLNYYGCKVQSITTICIVCYAV
jgi:hypothetical protein